MKNIKNEKEKICNTKILKVKDYDLTVKDICDLYGLSLFTTGKEWYITKNYKTGIKIK
jgi:hypothetical protein